MQTHVSKTAKALQDGELEAWLQDNWIQALWYLLMILKYHIETNTSTESDGRLIILH